MKGAVAAIILVTAAGCGVRDLSDADILEYAASTFDKRGMEGKEIVLGLHNGLKIVVEFPCADLCPAYTTRVIHYALPPGSACAAKGGVDRLISVPVGIGREERSYCVPAVLDRNWDRYRRW